MNISEQVTTFFLSKQLMTPAQLQQEMFVNNIMRMLRLGDELLAEAVRQRDSAPDVHIASDAMDSFNQISENMDLLEDALQIAMN